MGSGWATGAARILSGKEPALGTSIHLLLGGVTTRPDLQHPHVLSGLAKTPQSSSWPVSCISTSPTMPISGCLPAGSAMPQPPSPCSKQVGTCWGQGGGIPQRAQVHWGIEESDGGPAASPTLGCKPAPNPGMLLTMPFPVLAEAAGHVPAVLAALLVLVILVLLAVLYIQCRLNVLLWYRDRYGELEINGEPEVTPHWEQPPTVWGSHMLSLLHGSPQMGSCTMPTSPTPLPPMTVSSSTSS